MNLSIKGEPKMKLTTSTTVQTVTPQGDGSNLVTLFPAPVNTETLPGPVSVAAMPQYSFVAGTIPPSVGDPVTIETKFGSQTGLPQGGNPAPPSGSATAK
jgi:hypothetical protein